MTEKILNIALAVMFGLFCLVFAIKTVLIEVVKNEKDAEWEANKDKITTMAPDYEITMDSRYE